MKMQSWRTFQCDNCTLQASLRRGDDIDGGEGINGGSFRVIHAFMLHAYGNQQNGEDVQKKKTVLSSVESERQIGRRLC